MVDWISIVWVFLEIAYPFYAKFGESRILTDPEWIQTGLGVAFGVAIFFVEVRRRSAEESRAHAEQLRHAKELADVNLEAAKNHANLSGKLDMLGLFQSTQFQELRGVTNTIGQSPVTVVETATSEIAQLKSKVSRYEEILWGAIGEAEKWQLIKALMGLGKHTVAISSNGNTDCVELARDLRDCFKKPDGQSGLSSFTGH